MEIKLWVLLTCLQTVLKESCAVTVWEFGQDVPGSILSFQKQGAIRVWNKHVEVQLGIAPCMEIVYVRTEIENPISNPIVTYNNNTKVVLIEYGLLQSSKSWYNVISKSISNSLYCDRTATPPHHTQPIPYYPNSQVDYPHGYPKQPDQQPPNYPQEWNPSESNYPKNPQANRKPFRPRYDENQQSPNFFPVVFPIYSGGEVKCQLC